MTTITHEDIESNLTAHYELEEFEYHPALHVKVTSATSTRGSNLTGQGRDRTGIMIWPATHLLCQEIASGNVVRYDQTILELGCGCGLVGVVASLISNMLEKPNDCPFYFSTDMDLKALELCSRNYGLNGIETTNHRGPRIKQLSWGDEDQMQAILEELMEHAHVSKFDAIVAADIVYPSTAGQVLTDLFATVNFFLRHGGTFYLSFATRDGYRTPQRLIDAASTAGFAISSLPPLSSEVVTKLPPLLDSKVLLLQQSEHATEQNGRLGGRLCSVFPKLLEKMQRAAEESSDEEWDAPGEFEGSYEE